MNTNETRDSKPSRWVFLDPIFFLSLIVVGAIKWNHTTISQVAQQYPVPLYVYPKFHTIWILVMVSMLVFTVWEQFKKNRNSEAVKAISGGIVFASIYQSLWIVAWSYKVMLLTVIMSLCLWVVLVKTTTNARKEGGSRTLIFPLALWTGWATWQSFTNATVYFAYGLNSPFFLSGEWTVLIIVVITLFTLLWTFVMNEFAFITAIAFGMAGIFCDHHNKTTDMASLTAFSVLLSAIGICITLMVIVGNSAPSNSNYYDDIEAIDDEEGDGRESSRREGDRMVEDSERKYLVINSNEIAPPSYPTVPSTYYSPYPIQTPSPPSSPSAPGPYPPPPPYYQYSMVQPAPPTYPPYHQVYGATHSQL